MQTSPTQCNDERLRQSLDDVLSELQEEELARHLDACSACRCQLEQLAGGDSDWSKIELVLKRESSNESSFVAGGPLTTLDLDSRANFGHSLTADLHLQSDDFAVDFLKPVSLYTSPSPRD